MPITHQFVSAVADGSTATDVRPSNWNADLHSTWTNSTIAFREVLTRTAGITSSNTSAVSTLVSYVLPARVMGTNRMLRWTMMADFTVGSTAVANNFRLEVFHNSSRWADTNSTQAAVSAVPQALFMQVYIAALNSSATRTMWGMVYQSSVAAGVFGLGDATVTAFGDYRHITMIRSSGSYSVTSGAASTFSVGFNWLGANSSLSFRMRYNVLELV